MSGALEGDRPAAIWTRSYLMLVGAVLFTYANQMALLPLIPLYVTSKGGTEFFAGVVLAAFSVASVTLRPRIGRLVDTWDAGGVLFVGCLLLACATIGMLVPALWLLLVANAFRGVGWAAINTGSHVVLARLAPPGRRGEASSYFTLFQALAATLGPPLALYWLDRGGTFASLFVVCSASAIAAALLSVPMRERVGSLGRAITLHRGGWSVQEIVPSRTRLPAALIVLIMLSQSAVLGFVPLYAREIGVSPQAVVAFYVVSGVGSLLARSLLGRLSDIRSRGFSLMWGFSLCVGSLAVLSVTKSGAVLIALGGIYSLGQGMAIPAMTALAIERSDERRVGAAMAAYSAGFQVALAIGGLLAGALIALAGYRELYLAMTAVTSLGIVVGLSQWSALRRPAPNKA